MNPNEILEKMIDGASLAVVVGDLVAICHAKADHIRSNWQDEKLAREWERNGAALERACARITT